MRIVSTLQEDCKNILTFFSGLTIFTSSSIAGCIALSCLDMVLASPIRTVALACLTTAKVLHNLPHSSINSSSFSGYYCSCIVVAIFCFVFPASFAETIKRNIIHCEIILSKNVRRLWIYKIGSKLKSISKAPPQKNHLFLYYELNHCIWGMHLYILLLLSVPNSNKGCV